MGTRQQIVGYNLRQISTPRCQYGGLNGHLGGRTEHRRYGILEHKWPSNRLTVNVTVGQQNVEYALNSFREKGPLIMLTLSQKTNIFELTVVFTQILYRFLINVKRRHELALRLDQYL